MSMISSLGCVVNLLNPVTVFNHPVDACCKVFVILDPCHMLKLMRNMLADKGTLVDVNGGKIKWDFLVELKKLQTKEGLREGNKVTSRHIAWEKQKMKVNLAAQTLSSSVAEALEFCRDDLMLEEFKDCGATVKFIRTVDRVFDTLNSRNPLAKGCKAPLRKSNEQFWRPFVLEAKQYLFDLKLSDGTRICESNRKTGVVGLIVSLTSFCHLFDDLVGDNKPLSYLLGYKFSQDHIELFFGAIRGCGGWNNNPTARQFKAAYKRLLVHHEVKASATGNAVPQQSTDLLIISSRIEQKQDEAGAVYAVELCTSRTNYALASQPELSDHDYANLPNLKALSMYVENVAVYIAGLVVRKLVDKVSCQECKLSLVAPPRNIDECNVDRDRHTALLDRKNRGGLLIPSYDVVTVCKVCERSYRTRLNSSMGKPPAGKMEKAKLVSEVLNIFSISDVFSALKDHLLDTDAMLDHRVLLLKLIANTYLSVQFYHTGKLFTHRLQRYKIRSVLSKTIIFKGQ